jgi:trimeric autotransporter adhesin
MRRIAISALVFCLGICSQVSGQSGIITTVAGNGTPGFSGDGGPAASASLNLTSLGAVDIVDVVVDASGNLFIADSGNNRIRKVSASGIITTLAGNGTCCVSGDGGPATSASLNYPSGVAMDASGDLFIADSNNSVIRKVSASGIITTVADNGINGLSGDGGPATSASLWGPHGVVLDAFGNLFVADALNNRIREVSASGIITTVAGSGAVGVLNGNFSGESGPATSALLSGPEGVAVDTFGNLFIADSGNQRIRKVSASGIITTIAGDGNCCFSGDGGPATSTSLWEPSGVAVDASGNIFIADFGNNRVRKVSADGVITTVAGGGTGALGDGGPATSASLFAPTGVAVDAFGNLFIADSGNNRVRCVGGSIDPFRRNRFCHQYTDIIPDRRLDLPH